MITVVDIKGAFLHGKFCDGEEIYMKVPQGWEDCYSNLAALKLLKCIYRLKQAKMKYPIRSNQEAGRMKAMEMYFLIRLNQHTN